VSILYLMPSRTSSIAIPRAGRARSPLDKSPNLGVTRHVHSAALCPPARCLFTYLRSSAATIRPPLAPVAYRFGDPDYRQRPRFSAMYCNPLQCCFMVLELAKVAENFRFFGPRRACLRSRRLQVRALSGIVAPERDASRLENHVLGAASSIAPNRRACNHGTR
jgi:hypothetical protein